MNRRSFAIRAICAIAAAVGLRPPKKPIRKRIWNWRRIWFNWTLNAHAFTKCHDTIFIGERGFLTDRDRSTFWAMDLHGNGPKPFQFHTNFHTPTQKDDKTSLILAKREAERIANAILDMLEGENNE